MTDAVQGVGGAFLDAASRSAALASSQVPPPFDPVAMEQFAQGFHAASSIGSERITEPAKSVSINNIDESSGDYPTGESSYSQIFRHFTGSNDPLFGEVPKARELLLEPPKINTLSDLYGVHHKMMLANAEMTMLSTRMSLVVQTGFQLQRSVEKLVQQQG